ncbi:MAG: DUF4919 domain-containing protein [Firmicutes bacterium]|nr:DUF4919 domain-containing protein [Bacillota bacterium]MCM1400720.1 DUF4919 domain-containing protein [Bacteroides sp.]MCM1476414.1 DUF4919 domain-containing protein [Bacteroides sp.]
MKRFFILSIIMLLLSSVASAQLPFERIRRDKPNLEKIKREVNDRSGKFYYPKLMDKYLSNDTVMKLDEFRHLYIGYIFQEDYDPYRPSPAPDMNSNLYHSTNPTSAQLEEIISNAKTALASNPFDMRQISAMIAALNLLNRTDLAKIWQYKLNYLLMTIVSTGTGEDEDHAWFVIEPQHEYVLLNYLGYQVTNHLFYDPFYEYLTVVDVKAGKKGGFYFNLKPLLEEHYRKYPEEL